MHCYIVLSSITQCNSVLVSVTQFYSVLLSISQWNWLLLSVTLLSVTLLSVTLISVTLLSVTFFSVTKCHILALLSVIDFWIALRYVLLRSGNKRYVVLQREISSIEDFPLQKCWFLRAISRRNTKVLQMIYKVISLLSKIYS